MKVTLIYATPGAVDLLIYTKNTRLNMGPEGMATIREWSKDKKMEELKYMSRTLPSSWEFVDLIFSIEGVSRAFTHQLVRTRNASYAQQAMRVVNMEGFEYITGPSISGEAEKHYNEAMEEIQVAYDQLLGMNVQPEDARGILPTNICTNIVAKYNLRSFAEVVRKRSSGRVQSEYSEVLKQMIECVLAEWPWAVDFISDPRQQALDRITAYLKEQMQVELDAGTPMTKTKGWENLKDLDLIRGML